MERENPYKTIFLEPREFKDTASNRPHPRPSSSSASRIRDHQKKQTPAKPKYNLQQFQPYDICYVQSRPRAYPRVNSFLTKTFQAAGLALGAIAAYGMLSYFTAAGEGRLSALGQGAGNKVQNASSISVPQKGNGLESIVISGQRKIEKPTQLDYGIVLSSTTNEDSARVMTEILSEHGYRNVHVEKAKVHGKDYNRVVVGATKQDFDATIKRIEKEKPLGSASWFLVKNPTENKASVKQELAELKLEERFETYGKNITRDDYIALASPYIKIKNNSYSAKKNKFGVEEAKTLAGLIYDAARAENVPLFEFTGMIDRECKFSNKLGDLKYKGINNHSESYGQVRIQTMKDTWKLLHKEHPDIFSANPPKTIMNDPMRAIWISARYLRYCIERAEGELIMGISHYNAGPNSKYELGKLPNPDYVTDVFRNAREITSYFENQAPR